MARPRKQKSDSRGESVSFRLTPDELAAVEARAKKAGLTRSDYLRRMALKGKISVAPPARLDFKLVAELNRIGVNLNQMTRAANATGEVPPEVTRLCRRLETIITEAIAPVFESSPSAHSASESSKDKPPSPAKSNPTTPPSSGGGRRRR